MIADTDDFPPIGRALKVIIVSNVCVEAINKINVRRPAIAGAYGADFPRNPLA
jgi:hypothetical protein